MEYKRISDLLKILFDLTFKFMTKEWIETNNKSNSTCINSKTF